MIHTETKENCMMPKFAKGIAANIRVIAENSARVVYIDANIGTSGNAHDVAIARTQLVEEMDKAEKRIAEFLMQPGAKS